MNLITKSIDIVLSFTNIYLIEPSPGFKYVHKFALYPNCFFLKLTLKEVFHAFHLKFPEHLSLQMQQ